MRLTRAAGLAKEENAQKVEPRASARMSRSTEHRWDTSKSALSLATRLPLFTKLKTDDEMPLRREIHLSSFVLGGVGSADVSRAPHHLERDKETF